MRILLAALILMCASSAAAVTESFSYATGGCASAGCETGETWLNSNANEVADTINILAALHKIADPDEPGTTTAGIQEAVNACGTGVNGTDPSDGCTVRLPCGDITISDAITVGGNTTDTAKNGIRIIGCGAGATNEASKGTADANPSIGGTTLVADSSFSGAMIEFQACRECSVEHMGFNGAYRASTALDINASGASWPSSHSYVHDVDIRRTTGFAITTNDTTQADQLTLYKVSIRDTGGCLQSNHGSNVLTVFRDSECADTSSTGGKIGFDLVKGSFVFDSSFWGTSSTVTGQTGFRLGTELAQFTIRNSHLELLTDTSTLIDDNTGAGSGHNYAPNMMIATHIRVASTSGGVCFDVATRGAWAVIGNNFHIASGAACSSTFSMSNATDIANGQTLSFTNIGNVQLTGSTQETWNPTINTSVINTVLPPASFSGDATVSNTGVVSLANDVVAAAEMADADHGDISWSGGVASVDANAVALSTDTTGNYVATIADSGASEVTVSGSGSEGAAVTLAIASSITRDSELSAYTISTSDPVDGSDACSDGDQWLNKSGQTIFFCVDGSTDDWWGVNLSDAP